MGRAIAAGSRAGVGRRRDYALNERRGEARTVNVRLSDADIERVNAAARQQLTTQAEFLRNAVLDALEKEK